MLTTLPAGLDRFGVERIVREIILGSRTEPSPGPKLVVSISARHCHLTDEHVEKLFDRSVDQVRTFDERPTFGCYSPDAAVDMIATRIAMPPPSATICCSQSGL